MGGIRVSSMKDPRESPEKGSDLGTHVHHLWVGLGMFVTPSFPTSHLSPLPMLSLQITLVFLSGVPFSENTPYSWELMKSGPLQVLCNSCHFWPQQDVNTISVCLSSFHREERMSSTPKVGGGWRAGLNWE